MPAPTRMAVLLACCVALSHPVAAQSSVRDTSRIAISSYAAAGMMRFGPQFVLGATMAAPRSRIAARFDLTLGVAPAHEVPGTQFMAATAAGVFPILTARRVAPYLLAGAVVSQSRYLETAIGPVAGTGIRFQLGALRPYVEARVQQRTGLSTLLGITF
jgi:hypothetical protein